MGKKKKQKEPDFWEINWNRVKTWDDLMETIHKFGDILKSKVGNRDEDVSDYIESDLSDISCNSPNIERASEGEIIHNEE